MAGRYFLLTCLLVVLLFLTTEGKKGKRASLRGHLMHGKSIMLADDPLLGVTAFGPRTSIGQCTCKCCQPRPAPYTAPPCLNDIILAVDGSACFRDHHRRMVSFLAKLIGEIHQQGGDAQFGSDKTRLGVMQFSSNINHAVELSDYDNYQSLESSKAYRSSLQEKVRNLDFLGEGAFLNKALNETVHAFNRNPRLPSVLERHPKPRKIVVLLTNGKSHPDVLDSDIEASISLLKQNNVYVYPISVTRQCLAMSSPEWDEGLCPDVNILKLLAKLGAGEDDEFLPMRSAAGKVAKEITDCQHKEPQRLVSNCNNCTCDCELPIGPEGAKGDQGPKGDSIRGEIGFDGNPGEKGEPGRDGPIGLTGRLGEKGDVGPLGPIGNTGPRGIKGEWGIQGPTGEEGEKGEVGPNGSKGDIGDTGGIGPRGFIGKTGEPGDKGIHGEIGFTGPKGATGDQGQNGEPGIGIDGIDGQKGEHGNKGDFGPKGVIGNNGPKGNQGLCGKPGPAGVPGLIGLAGIDGSDGATGPPGSQGPRGPEGIQGRRGDVGEQGPQGDAGSSGPRGSAGLRGEQGEPGQSGLNGVDSDVPGPRGPGGVGGQKGERGSRGGDGLNGLQGVPGTQGPRGEVGSKGEEGALNIEALRPMIVNIIRELLPGDCVGRPEPEPCSEYPIDLVFLIDGSDSIDREDFASVQQWILRTVDSFRPMERLNKLHIDVVQFSEMSRTEVHSLIQESSVEIQDEIHAIEQMRSGTKTYSGLRFVNSQVSPQIRSGSYKILITMTDGDASEDRDQAAIDEARAFYNIMLGVGVGDKIDFQELSDFAHKDRVITVDEFTALEGVIDQIVEESCTEIGTQIREGAAGGSTGGPTENGSEPTPPPDNAYSRCADSMADIAFLIDGSSSVGDEDFALLRHFLYDLVGSFEFIGLDGFRVSIIQYNERPRIQLRFEDSVDQVAVLNTIENIEYMTGNTQTGLALVTAGNIFKRIREEDTTRASASQVVIVITDGRSQDDVAEPAYALRDAGVTVFAVGVTDSSLEVELKEIATSPASEHIYTVETYSEIADIKDVLLEKICNAVRGSYRVVVDGVIVHSTGTVLMEEELIGAPNTDDEDYVLNGSGLNGEVSFEMFS